MAKMKRELLSEGEIVGILAGSQWQFRGNALFLHKEFKDFVSAFAFMQKGALISEQLNHHPNWSNVYNKVTISLFTHDAGGVTDVDIEWARR